MALVESHEEVDSYLTSWNVSARVEEINSWITTFIVSGPVNEFGFRVTEGRMFSAPNEAVVGLGLAEFYGLKVGNRVTVLEPSRTQLTIVGKYVYWANNGTVLMYSVDTLGEMDAEGTLDLKLARGVEAGDFAQTLLAETGGRVVVTDAVQEYQDALEDERSLIPLMLSLNSILIALAATNMLIALFFAVRERTREFGVMKTVGFAPRQIIFTVILGAAVLAVIGVVIGAPIGYYLARLWILEAADTQSLPSDIMRLPGLPWLALMAPLAAGLAALGSALPARRAATVTVAEALRFE